jgi:histone H3/H4
MDTELFVTAIRRYVRDAAVEDVISKLKKPPGRRVLIERKATSDWFNALSEADASYVKQVVEDAVDEAIFGLFAVLDGSRTICEGRFELIYVGEKQVLLNDPDKIGLNEVFNAVD